MVHEAEIVSQRTINATGIGIDCEPMITNNYTVITGSHEFNASGRIRARHRDKVDDIRISIYYSLQQERPISLRSWGRDRITTCSRWYIGVGVDCEPMLTNSYTVITGSHEFNTWSKGRTRNRDTADDIRISTHHIPQQQRSISHGSERARIHNTQRADGTSTGVDYDCMSLWAYTQQIIYRWLLITASDEYNTRSRVRHVSRPVDRDRITTHSSTTDVRHQYRSLLWS